MNEYWNVPGTTALVSLHQNEQHQSAATVQTLNLPHHLRTTPDWSIKNTVMMDEAIEDKNNDSGVSPGHYETSPSPEHRSSENRSSSSCSGTSHESLPGPSTNYPYTPQQSHIKEEVPMDYATSQSDSLISKSQPLTDGEMVVVSNNIRRRRERAVSRVQRSEFECPLCGFKTLERDALWEHLKQHYNPNRLEDEPPVPLTIPIPGCTPDEIAERIVKHEESINFPVLNNQGKVKVNYCKICRFRALTKVEFWRHIKLHTKVEKRLCCQYCPFVTDLKHHYEYHMNKQTGSKPFSCKLCKYSCVNKSMLSSHMKSHTDVRQFSCADCPYVTKYCHSVKMHLRKYAHEPGPILNPDGTVNTTITIDVYGTRRGPKQKKVALKSANQSASQLQLSPILPPSDIATTSNDVKPFQDASSMSMVVMPQSSSSNECSPMMMNTMPLVNPFSGAGLNSMLATQYNHILRAGFPIAQPYVNNGEITANNINQMRTNILAEYLKAAERIRAANASTNSQVMQNYYNTQSYMNVPQPVADISAQHTSIHENAIQDSIQVLDLSRHSIASSSNSSNNNNDNSSSGSSSNVDDHQISHPVVVNQHMSSRIPFSKSPSITPGTSRRKGRAVKLNRRTINNDTDDDMQSEDNAAERTSPESCVSSENTNDFGYNATETNNTVTLKCAYCPISFGSEAMYTIHMGYHGYKDPYTCNICGQRCEDALSFNVHLSRSSHD